jgi:hypothetical protein
MVELKRYGLNPRAFVHSAQTETKNIIEAEPPFFTQGLCADGMILSALPPRSPCGMAMGNRCRGLDRSQALDQLIGGKCGVIKTRHH